MEHADWLIEWGWSVSWYCEVDNREHVGGVKGTLNHSTGKSLSLSLSLSLSPLKIFWYDFIVQFIYEK